MKTIIIIPARMASQRLPNKPMALIDGIPMIQRVWEKAKLANIGEVVVACCEKIVFDKINSIGGTAIMTNPNLPSGTDRVYEIINNHLSYDIKYLAILDLSYKPVEQNIKNNHSIIFMNRRPNNERFQTAKYLYNNYKNRILLSFLCKYGRSDDEFNKKLPLELDPSKSVMAGNAWAGIETIRKFLNDAYVMLIFETNWSSHRLLN